MNDYNVGNTNLEFRLPMTTTLAELSDILTRLSCCGKYDVGGDDGQVGYVFDGQVYLYEIDSEDMPEMLRVIIEDVHCWPSYVQICGCDRELYGSPGRDRFGSIGLDYNDLWQWMIQEASRPDREDEKDESEIYRSAAGRYPSVSDG